MHYLSSILFSDKVDISAEFMSASDKVVNFQHDFMALFAPDDPTFNILFQNVDTTNFKTAIDLGGECVRVCETEKYQIHLTWESASVRTWNWGGHISKIASKGNPTLKFSRRNLKGWPSKLKEIAYVSMVVSLFEYPWPVGNPYRQGEIDKLNKIQRAAVRFVTKNYQRKSSVTSLIQDLCWTDLQTRSKNFRLTSL